MQTKKFLFISESALISDIAWHTVQEGHEVKYCIEDKSEADNADGFIPKVEDWKKEVDWADVIVFDDVLGYGAKAQKLRSMGKNVIGGTPYTDRLEDDRSFGQDELKKHGVNILSYQKFSDFDDAIEFVNSHEVDVVILDVLMPGKDGVEVLREVKTVNPIVEVIMLTGHGTIETAIEGLKLGAYDYLLKPTDTGELVAKILRAYARKSEQEDRIRRAEIANIVAKRGW